jgi:hypothetical protein
MINKFSLIKILIFMILVITIRNDEQFLQSLSDDFYLSEPSIINVRCFWIKGWNVYDISPLEKSDNT